MQGGGEGRAKERHLTVTPTADTEPSKPEEAGEGESLVRTRTRVVGERGSCAEEKGQLRVLLAPACKGQREGICRLTQGCSQGKRTSTRASDARERVISCQHLWLTVVRALSDPEMTGGSPLPGRSGQRKERGKEAGRASRPPRRPPFPLREQGGAERSRGSSGRRQEGGPVSASPPRLRDGRTAQLPLPPQKGRGGEDISCPLPQASASDERQEEDLAGSRLLFSPLSPLQG